MDWTLLIEAIFGASSPSPPSWTWYDIAKDFGSPALIGALGFGGVMLTLKHNARLAREQHDRDIFLREKVVRSRLFVELSHVKSILQRNLKQLEDFEPDCESILLGIPPQISAVNSVDLGLLEISEVGMVFDVSKAIEGFRVRLLTSCKEGAETTDSIVGIPPFFRSSFIEMTVGADKLVEFCIERLKHK